MSILPTIRHMQYLVALAEHGQFQKAATECHVTQSTLSAGIADLEDILGAPVIDRTRNKRGVHFTDLGNRTLIHANKILELSHALIDEAQALKAPLSVPLRMGIIPTVAPYLLPRFLKPLQKKLPQLELHIHEMQSASIVDALDNDKLDFALMAFPFDTKELKQKILFKETFVCAAPMGSFGAFKTISIADLDPYKILLLDDGNCMRDHALNGCKWPKTAPTKTLSAASLATLMQLVAQGYGVTLLPEMAITDKNSIPPNISLRRFTKDAPSRQIGFCFKKSKQRQEDINTVCGCIADLLEGTVQPESQKRLK